MKHIKYSKILSVSLCAALLLLNFGCKSKKINEDIEEPEVTTGTTVVKHNNAMFWELNGETEDGEQSTVYILGTYHVGDERLYPVDSAVEDAWKEADRLVAELSEEDWKNFQQAVTDKTMESIIVNSGKTLVDELSSKELSLAATYLGEEVIAAAVCYEPWVLNSMLSTNLIFASGLTPDYSYDVNLITLAGQEGRTFEGLDELKTQVNLNAYGDWNTQLLMLHETIKGLENLDESKKEICDTYEAYLTHDTDVMADIYFKGINEDLEKHPELEPYINDLLYNRNSLWAKKIAEYLKESKTTFIFAGAGHFIGDDSVFEFMRRNGDLD